jgi:hypothetical protein
VFGEYSDGQECAREYSDGPECVREYFDGQECAREYSYGPEGVQYSDGLYVREYSVDRNV